MLLFQRLRCQRKEPCRLFTVRKKETHFEVNTNTLCQCPHGHSCPKHHMEPGVIPGKSYTDDGIRTFSGYCMWTEWLKLLIWTQPFFSTWRCHRRLTNPSDKGAICFGFGKEFEVDKHTVRAFFSGLITKKIHAIICSTELVNICTVFVGENFFNIEMGRENKRNKKKLIISDLNLQKKLKYKGVIVLPRSLWSLSLISSEFGDHGRHLKGWNQWEISLNFLYIAEKKYFYVVLKKL